MERNWKATERQLERTKGTMELELKLERKCNGTVKQLKSHEKATGKELELKLELKQE